MYMGLNNFSTELKGNTHHYRILRLGFTAYMVLIIEKKVDSTIKYLNFRRPDDWTKSEK